MKGDINPPAKPIKENPTPAAPDVPVPASAPEQSMDVKTETPAQTEESPAVQPTQIPEEIQAQPVENKPAAQTPVQTAPKKSSSAFWIIIIILLVVILGAGTALVVTGGVSLDSITQDILPGSKTEEAAPATGDEVTDSVTTGDVLDIDLGKVDTDLKSVDIQLSSADSGLSDQQTDLSE